MSKNDFPSGFKQVCSGIFSGLKTGFDSLPFRKFRIFYPFLIILNIVLAVYIVYTVFLSTNRWKGDAEKKFRLEKGSTLTSVIKDLENEGIIENGFAFKLAAKLTFKEDNIIPRRYIFRSGMSNLEILGMITNPGLVQTVKFRLPEGYTIKRLSSLVEKKLALSKGKFIQETENKEIVRELGLPPEVKNLEGFLFPDTYLVSINADEEELVRIFTDEFRRRVLDNEEFMTGLERRNESLLKAVTMASIIEGETYLEEEMPVISGVYHNRIRKRMRLEADPTVQYALPDGPKKRLLYKDLRIDSPYNTYRNFGLPPGPINNPGLNAILAAVNPASHNYVFFVATGDGGHKFSETYAKHLEAVAEYRRRLKQKQQK